MALTDVLSAITWPNVSNGTITPIAATDPLRALVEGYITTLYNGSPTYAVSILEAASIAGNLNFLKSSDGDHSLTISGIPAIAFDFNEISNLYYFNDKGQLFHEKPELTVIHEIIHAMGLSDPLPPLVSPTNAQMSAAFDFDGDTVRSQNEVARELGYTDNVQKNYYSSILSTWDIFQRFDTSISYSEGHTVDTAVIPENEGAGNDTLDLTSSYKANSVDIIFGLEGDDNLKGGGGSDYIYGGDDGRIRAVLDHVAVGAGPELPIRQHDYCARDRRYPAAIASASVQNISSARVSLQ